MLDDKLLGLAKVISPLLPGNRDVIVDLTAGDGSLLLGLADSDTRHLLAVEIQKMGNPKVDREAYNPLHWSRLTGDLTLVYPLMAEAQFRADLFALNPPDTDWDRERLNALSNSLNNNVQWAFSKTEGPINSVVATMMIALDCMTERGEGVLIANNDTVERLVFDDDAPYSDLAKHVWARFIVDGDLTHEKGVGQTSIVCFAASHIGPCQTITGLANLKQLEMAVNRTPRVGHRYGLSIVFSSHASDSTVERFSAVKDEWRNRNSGSRDDWNIWVDSEGMIQTQLNRFDEYSTRINNLQVSALHQMRGKRPMELVMQVATRLALKAVVESSLWRVEPNLPKQVANAIREYDAVRSPLTPLSEAQRLGFCDEESHLPCKENMWNGAPDPIFVAGKRYELVSRKVLVERYDSKPNNEGGMDEILLNGHELLLCLKGEDGKEHTFFDSRHMQEGIVITEVGGTKGIKPDFSLQEMLQHFDIPEVADVSITKKEVYESNKLTIDKMQSFIHQYIDPNFKLKPLQREDLARAGTQDGCVFAWGCGTGKSIATIIYALLRVGVDWSTSVAKRGLYPLKPVLLVAPENLHAQNQEEWLNRFGLKCTVIDCQETYLKLTNGGLNHLKAGWYVTSYFELGLNKIREMPDPDECERTFTDVASLMNFYRVELQDVKEFRPSEDDPPLAEGGNLLLHNAVNLCRSLQNRYGRGVGEWLSDHRKAEQLLGKVVERKPITQDIKCIYSASLADLSGHEFACVVIDEGTRIKGKNTVVGRAVRELDPPNRLVLTATPIKNRLPDLYWLIWWAAGGKDEAHPRFPFTGDSDQQDKFAGDYCVCERNLTQEMKRNKGKRRTKGKKPRGKPGVEICNIHALWKLIAPNILRRRKEDFGVDIVKKIKHVIRSPMGTRQADVYRYHLLGHYVSSDGKDATIAQLTRLRQVAAAPTNQDLVQLPPSCEHFHGPFRSDRDYIPKLAAALKILDQRMRAGEQTVIFSAFHEPLDTLSARLNEACVPHDVLDGRKSAAWRGKMSKEFGRGLPTAKPVLLGGLKAMAEGNNWPRANNVIVLAYDWAWDLYEQAINRVHRMNSPKDVNVWAIVTDGTIERRLEAMTDEKGDSSDLVIDGKLMGQQAEEVNLAELLKAAFAEFNRGDVKTFDEQILEREWPELKSRLTDAWAICKQK